MTYDSADKSNEARTVPALEYLARLGTNDSRRAARSALVQVVRHLGSFDTIETFQWSKLSTAQILAARESLASSVGPGTANRYLATLRGVLRACWNQRQLSTDDFMRLTEFPRVKGHRKTRRRALVQDEVRRLFEAARTARTPWLSARDHALVVVLYSTGIRRGETVGICMHDVVLEDDGVRIRVLGKGNKERDVWASVEVRRIIERWMEVRGDWQGPLFPGKRKSKRAMSVQYVTQKIRAIAKRAKLGVVTPHDCRRTCITTLLDEGADLLAVRDLAGHASITTTAIYDLRGERAAKAARLRFELRCSHPQTTGKRCKAIGNLMQSIGEFVTSLSKQT